MEREGRKDLTVLIVVALASLLCSSFAMAQGKSQRARPMGNISSVDSSGKQGTGKSLIDKVKSAGHKKSIFDDQADEFEEPTYTSSADAEAKIKAIPKMPSDIKKHLKDKYRMKGDHFVYSELEQTPHGPKGYISIEGGNGDLRSKVVSEGTKEERMRGMAKTLIEGEVSLFGIHDFEELRERKLVVNDLGITHLYFQRYIGDMPVEDSHVHVSFGPKEDINDITVKAVPMPPEAYHAAAKKTLGRGKIFRIINEDLGGIGVAVSKVEKLAIPEPPYVIWQVRTADWDYRIDAFTGQILRKVSTIRTLVPR